MDARRNGQIPLMCTGDKGGHIDYGLPLVFSKSNDYRSATKRAHDFIPSVPQNFDCNVKALINPQMLNVDVTVKDEGLKSTYNKFFDNKVTQDHPLKKISLPPHSNDYGRVVEEKMIVDPPPTGKVKLSEMKDNYRMNFYTPKAREMQAPIKEATCKIEALGGDIQPSVRPEEPGFWKHLDIYLTTNKMNYVPFTNEQRNIAKEHIITYYSATGKWRGYNDTLTKRTGNSAIFDRSVFKNELPWQSLSRAPKHVPNFGLSSTYRDSYIDQTYSDMAPYIAGRNNAVKFEGTLDGPSPWQDISAPGMYCSESCHIGTGWPVRSVVDISDVKKH